MRAHDGRCGGSAALLGRLEAVLGPAAGLPGLLYPRTDRPAVLASFAPEVAACASGDPVAEGILREAARHIADTAAAVCPRPVDPGEPKGTGTAGTAGAAGAAGAAGETGMAPRVCETTPACEVALTGGLLKLGEPLLVPLYEALAQELPHARPVPAAGDPLDGALEIASALATHSLAFPYDPYMLHVSGHQTR
ncbi:hypothetical protein ACWGIG_38830, partial [Streptomyces sp. NPDC054863]